MKKIVSVLMVMLLFSMVGAPVITSAQDDVNDLTLHVRLDKDNYAPGETAVATVYITSAAAEAASLLRGLHTNLTFAGMQLERHAFNTAIPAPANGEVLEIDDAVVSGQSVAYLLWVSDTGISFQDLYGGTVSDSAEIEIAELYFTVGIEAAVSIAFADINLPGTLPYEVALLDGNLSKYSCGFSAAHDTSEVLAYRLDADAPVSTGTGISASAVFSAKENMVLIAKLASTTENRLLAPIAIQFIAPGRNALDFQFTYSGNAANTAVTYYIWDAVSGMKPLAGYTPVMVQTE